MTSRHVPPQGPAAPPRKRGVLRFLTVVAFCVIGITVLVMHAHHARADSPPPVPVVAPQQHHYSYATYRGHRIYYTRHKRRYFMSNHQRHYLPHGAMADPS